ncbi:hypothetical protein GCM10025868_02890 [Angustibacter aerolatus]|uniref:Uncharacterized protein n=1 Tax=Angustibacter aerolatus TaxID=1162965 RepID=A0ABQ6JCW3_9ACTN|nr:hypothetical protein GCM10025868_02890 [Angustibacter aerolatus]
MAAARGTTGCTADPVCAGTLAQVQTGVGTLRTNTQAAAGGLGDVSDGLGALKTSLTGAAAGLAAVECGLSNTALAACDADRAGLLQGVGQVDAGVSLLVDTVVANVQAGVGTNADTPADETLRGGVNGLQTGVDAIDAGSRLVAGLAQAQRRRRAGRRGQRRPGRWAR